MLCYAMANMRRLSISLVGCMKENFDSFTYFSADGTILRSFAKYFCAEHIIAESWCILKQFLSNFDANSKHMLKHCRSNFKATFEELCEAILE